MQLTVQLLTRVKIFRVNVHPPPPPGCEFDLLQSKMLHILDILLHKFQLVCSSFYNVKSYTNLSLMMSEQKIAIQNFQTNSHPALPHQQMSVI